MSNTPSDEELNSVLCHHWPAFPMQAVLVQMWLRDAMRAALAKWGTPQPVVQEPLTDEQLWANDEIMSLNADLGWYMETIRMFARAIERAHGIKGGQHGAE